jgi:hypothetical protein
MRICYFGRITQTLSTILRWMTSLSLPYMKMSLHPPQLPLHREHVTLSSMVSAF